MTIPDFAPIKQENLDYFPFHSTSPGFNWFYSYITHINVCSLLQCSSPKKRYHCVTKLSFGKNVTVDCIENLRTYVDLQHVRHFEVSLHHNINNKLLLLSTLARFITEMTHLSTVDMQNCDLVQYLPSRADSVEELILSSNFPSKLNLSSHYYSELIAKNHVCRNFPRLKSINISCGSSWIICYLINHLNRLEKATFSIRCLVLYEVPGADDFECTKAMPPFHGELYCVT
jgi:hypothetical protein